MLPRVPVYVGLQGCAVKPPTSLAVVTPAV